MVYLMELVMADDAARWGLDGRGSVASGGGP